MPCVAWRNSIRARARSSRCASSPASASRRPPRRSPCRQSPSCATGAWPGPGCSRSFEDVADQDVDRWRRLDRLCSEALHLAPGERGVFLQRASGGDEALRSDVEVLLECDEAAGGFLERPAVEELAEALAEDVSSLVGQDIGGYRIESLLGAGGMGEVYRARDLKLD